MKNLRKIKYNIYVKLVLMEVVVVLLMKLLVPLLANYPPNSEEPQFQHLIEPLTHNMQYLVLGSFGVILYILFISILMKKVFKYIEKDKSEVTFEEIQDIRATCFSFPKRILIVQLIVIVTVLIILFTSMSLDLHLIFKFLFIYFSFFIVTSIISSILIKNDMDAILISTYEISSKYEKQLKSKKFSSELIGNILPFFTVIIITIALLGYSKSNSAIGESYYYYYYVTLKDMNFNGLSIDKIKNILDTVPLKSPTDYYFIQNGEDFIFSNNTGSISTFFKTYADTFLTKTNGRVYEYYGIEQEGYVKKVILDNGNEAYIGFKYSTASDGLISYFMAITIISILSYLIILILWSKNTSQNIEKISNQLSDIAEQKDLSKISVLPITSNDEIGRLTESFNKIQETSKNNINTIRSSQSQLVEQERLASLGQMIGGIAHNLKTPIMSISGAAEALNDLTTELDKSIGNPIVTDEDYHDIVKDYQAWIAKIKDYTEYMSDVITAVKGQAVNLSNDSENKFTIYELLKRIDILMKHELKNALIYLNVSVKIDENTIITGDVNSLVQVINNMISNAIQAYGGTPNKSIDLIVTKQNNCCVISIKDYASGLSEKIKDKLFKEMVTTKGKNGTGLGLYMSYSTIKAHFNGEITFESEEGKGTTFNIILPIK